MIDISKLMEGLHDLSDAELQRREWVESQNSTVQFFSEMVSQVFDDTGLAEHLEIDKCPDELDEQIYLELKKLDRSVSRVDDSIPPDVLLNSPEIEHVRKLASVTLNMLAKRFAS